MDWQNDPELNELREEFIDSFPERAETLRRVLGREREDPARLKTEVESIAHKLAGVAGNYGFSVLGTIAATLEDWMISEKFDPDRLQEYTELLESALQKAIVERADPTEFAEDRRLRKLTSGA